MKQERFREQRKTFCLEKAALKEEVDEKNVKKEEKYEAKTITEIEAYEHEEGELVSVNGVDNNFINVFFVA